MLHYDFFKELQKLQKRGISPSFRSAPYQRQLSQLKFSAQQYCSLEHLFGQWCLLKIQTFVLKRKKKPANWQTGYILSQRWALTRWKNGEQNRDTDFYNFYNRREKAFPFLLQITYDYSSYHTATPAQRGVKPPVQLKCTFDFQRVALRFIAEVNRNENILKCKTFPTHTSSKCISFASKLRTSRERPN